MVSKKTVYRIRCFRGKISQGIILRPGELAHSMSVEHPQVIDISGCADLDILTVELMLGTCNVPIRLQLQRVEPPAKGLLGREYHEGGPTSKKPMRSYGLADIEEATSELQAYVNANAIDGLEEAAKDSDDIIQLTFQMIAQVCRDTLGKYADHENTTDMDATPNGFLVMFVRMWFAIRHQVATGWICSSETTGLDDGKASRIAIPYMVKVQLHDILHNKLLMVMVPRLLRMMEEYISFPKENTWFAVYLASFLLLHQTSTQSSEQARWAMDNQKSGTPPVSNQPPHTAHPNNKPIHGPVYPACY